MERFTGQLEIFNNTESRIFFPEKEKVIKLLKSTFDNCAGILQAKIYGSWPKSEESRDVDICAIVGDDENIISPELYDELRSLRLLLVNETQQDIDLVPHTVDELFDKRSGLNHPRFNSKITKGFDVKGSLKILPNFYKDDIFRYEDLCVLSMHETRTICRRQIIRSLSFDESRIFISKLSRGAWDALMWESCVGKVPYKEFTGDISKELELFDEAFGTDSSNFCEFLRDSKKKDFTYGDAKKLINWYELIMNLVLTKKSESSIIRYNLANRNLHTYE